jgi:hypothetical protein
MTSDSLGNRDEMAIVVSKQELDWNAINQQVSQNPQTDFGSRLSSVLSSKLIKNVTFQSSGNGTMQFKVNGDDNQVVASIVSIDKQ